MGREEAEGSREDGSGTESDSATVFSKRDRKISGKKREKGAGVGYWKMNGLEDKCMQARAGRPPLYAAPLP